MTSNGSIKAAQHEPHGFPDWSYHSPAGRYGGVPSTVIIHGTTPPSAPPIPQGSLVCERDDGRRTYSWRQDDVRTSVWCVDDVIEDVRFEFPPGRYFVGDPALVWNDASFAKDLDAVLTEEGHDDGLYERKRNRGMMLLMTPHSTTTVFRSTSGILLPSSGRLCVMDTQLFDALSLEVVGIVEYFPEGMNVHFGCGIITVDGGTGSKFIQIAT